MGGPPSGGYDWLSLLLVGVPGTVLGGITLAVVLLDRVRSRASKDGQDAADILALEGKLTTLGENEESTGAILQKHLIDCAKNQGRIEEVLVSLKEGQQRAERTIEGLQRTVANWMRDRERAGP